MGACSSSQNLAKSEAMSSACSHHKAMKILFANNIFFVAPLSCTLSSNTTCFCLVSRFHSSAFPSSSYPASVWSAFGPESGNFPFSHSGLWASKDVLTAHSYQDFVAFFDHLAHACDTGVVPAVPRWGSRGEILSLWHIHVSLLDGEVDCRCSWDGAPQVQAVTLVQMCGRRFQLGFGK